MQPLDMGWCSFVLIMKNNQNSGSLAQYSKVGLPETYHKM